MTQSTSSSKWHRSFEKELRSLVKSRRKEDKERAGIVASEIKRLVSLKSEGKPHPDEGSLSGKLREIKKLELYHSGYSIRVYFFVGSGVIWILGMDVAKRRTKMTSGAEKSLKDRLSGIKESKKNKTKRKQ